MLHFCLCVCARERERVRGTAHIWVCECVFFCVCEGKWLQASRVSSEKEQQTGSDRKEKKTQRVQRTSAQTDEMTLHFNCILFRECPVIIVWGRVILYRGSLILPPIMRSQIASVWAYRIVFRSAVDDASVWGTMMYHCSRICLSFHQTRGYPVCISIRRKLFGSW